MANTAQSFDSEHQGSINDLKFDYYGKKLATAGLEGKIQIFEILTDNQQKKIAEIVGHDNAVWSLSWSHPRFGSLLASGGFDKKVIIWREVGKSWEKLYEYTHNNSVNCVTFAPQEYGLILLCGSSDGYISIHEYKNENWHMHKTLAHGFGVTSVSWGPHLEGGNLRFASAGMDNLILIWQSKNNQIDSFYVATTLEGHEDVVKDVSWRNMPSSNYDLIASGGDDNSLLLWINTNNNSQTEAGEDTSYNASEWKKYELKKFPVSISKISWEENGVVLAVGTSDGLVSLFKEQTEGLWFLFSQMNSEGVMEDFLEQENNIEKN